MAATATTSAKMAAQMANFMSFMRTQRTTAAATNAHATTNQWGYSASESNMPHNGIVRAVYAK
jgi:hypothetical protein